MKKIIIAALLICPIFAFAQSRGDMLVVRDVWKSTNNASKSKREKIPVDEKDVDKLNKLLEELSIQRINVKKIPVGSAEATTPKNSTEWLTQNYPEFIGTRVEKSLKEKYENNHKIIVRKVEYKVPEFDLTTTNSETTLIITLSTGEKIISKGVKGRDIATFPASTLINNNGNQS